MKKWALVFLALVLSGTVLVFGYNRFHEYRLKQAVGSVDVVDKDFVALIGTTELPYVYNIEVKLVNDSVDKKFSALELFPVLVDFILTDVNGQVYTGDVGAQKYAENVEKEMAATNHYVTQFSGQVRLIPKDLSAGVYEVEPRVRIWETGEDALRGPYKDFGSVAIPAGNKVTVEIK